MENYNNDIIRKIFIVFDKLDINPEDFIKHIDEDDYTDPDEFKQEFFKYLLYKAHLTKYIKNNSDNSDDTDDINDSSFINDYPDDYFEDGGQKNNCDEVFKKNIVYAIAVNQEKYNNIIDQLSENLENEFRDDNGKFIGGTDDKLIDKLKFYWTI